MSELKVTLIDVGWGDSIFLESIDNDGKSHYGLIDSNDTKYRLSSFIFLKRFFEKKEIDIEKNIPIFDFIMLSHWHSDHLQGLPRIIREFGSKNIYYPKTSKSQGYLLRSLRKSSLSRLKNSGKIENYQAIDKTHTEHKLLKLGNVELKILWPLNDDFDKDNENNNSIVFTAKIENHSLVFTGDAEEEVWNNIKNEIPTDTIFFKVPHHGSRNGTFDSNGDSTWFNYCPQDAHLAISSHIRPFKHPHQEVIDFFEDNNSKYYRTDKHYHITFETDGLNQPTVKYYH